MEKMVEVERATQEELRQDLKSLFQGAIRVTLEMVLEEELKAMVGARRFERVGSRKDHRNGTYLERGLSGVELVIADEHAGLAAALRRFLPEVRRQRCTVHLQRNVLAKVPHRLRKRVAREVAAVFRAPGLAKAKKRLAEITARWHNELPEAMRVLERGFTAATQFYVFPEPHWARLRTTNSLERLHTEIKRRIRSAGAFPDRASALRLITAVALRTTAVWSERRYLDLSLLEPKEVAKAA